jgi:hypothetical protein
VVELEVIMIQMPEGLVALEEVQLQPMVLQFLEVLLRQELFLDQQLYLLRHMVLEAVTPQAQEAVTTVKVQAAAVQAVKVLTIYVQIQDLVDLVVFLKSQADHFYMLQEVEVVAIIQMILVML